MSPVPKEQPTILITGASGFIGSFLAEEALDRGMKVIAAVRGTSSRKYLQDNRIVFVELDFSSAANLAGKLEKLVSEFGKIDYVVHNAGITKAPKEDDYLEINTRFTQNFLDALIRAKAIPSKFVYMSSLAAYGPGNPVTMEPIKDKHIPAPLTAYGKSKLLAENAIKARQDIPWAIIRPTAVFGPREKEIFALFKIVNRHLHPWIRVKNQKMSFIYVKDLVRAVLDAAVSPLSARSYFISDGQTYQGNVFGEYVKKVLGKKALDIPVSGKLMKAIARLLEMLTALVGKTPGLNSEKAVELGSVNWTCDISPAVTELNFKPHYTLGSAIEETAVWYKKEGWL